jgi:hypothetical protein
MTKFHSSLWLNKIPTFEMHFYCTKTRQYGLLSGLLISCIGDLAGEKLFELVCFWDGNSQFTCHLALS